MKTKRWLPAILLPVALLCMAPSCNGDKIDWETEISVSAQQPDGHYCAAVGNADQTIDLQLPPGYYVSASGVHDPNGGFLAAGSTVQVTGMVHEAPSLCGRNFRIEVTGLAPG